jgi:hypothetical protein
MVPNVLLNKTHVGRNFGKPGKSQWFQVLVVCWADNVRSRVYKVLVAAAATAGIGANVTLLLICGGEEEVHVTLWTGVAVVFENVPHAAYKKIKINYSLAAFKSLNRMHKNLTIRYTVPSAFIGVILKLLNWCHSDICHHKTIGPVSQWHSTCQSKNVSHFHISKRIDEDFWQRLTV